VASWPTAVHYCPKAKGLRQGENARWRGHLDKLLPGRGKLSRGHFAAMPYSQVPAFMAALRERGAMAALALEFLILTAARSGEVLGARWSEIDLAANVWTIPPVRMKAEREHRVPLSGRALAILEKLAAAKTSDFIFPGQRPSQGLSGMALEMMLRRGDALEKRRALMEAWAAYCEPKDVSNVFALKTRA
jgi:integrase